MSNEIKASSEAPSAIAKLQSYPPIPDEIEACKAYALNLIVKHSEAMHEIDRLNALIDELNTESDSYEQLPKLDELYASLVCANQKQKEEIEELVFKQQEPIMNCPVCKRSMSKTKDGWEGAPWRWVCIYGSCHFAASIYANE